MSRVAAVLMVFLAVLPCTAAVITVDPDGSADYQTVQEAINNAQDGDTIVVRPGTYQEQVGFNSRAVTVRSADPNDSAVVEATIIAASSGYSVFFDFGEGSDSVLEGFTITGRGIFCTGASPTIRGNVIRDCDEAGITGESEAAPTILGNTISHNDLGIVYCDGLIRGNTISDNIQEGIHTCNGVIKDNVITRNVAGPGQLCRSDSGQRDYRQR